jgi:hypothetical protein
VREIVGAQRGNGLGAEGVEVTRERFVIEVGERVSHATRGTLCEPPRRANLTPR